MKKLINKLAHACGLYTADDVEHIEKHWREKLDKATTVDIKLAASGGGGGGGVDMRGRGGAGGIGGIGGPGFTWYSRANEPVFIPATPSQGQTLIIKPDKLPEAQGPTSLTGPERRELAHEAARWCKQQNIEVSPENIIFYLDNRRMISAPTPETAEKEEKTKPTKCRKCINYGWGMPQCRECKPENNWKYFQIDL